jgi:hypothetical protein
MKSIVLSVLMGALAIAPRPAWAQDETNAEADLWVSGNLMFLAYHELGHLLQDQVLGIDQISDRLGSEQRADDIATWLLAPDPGEADQSSETIVAIEGWLLAGEMSADEGPWTSVHYPDDNTRAARIACLLYGSDEETPNAFEELTPIIEMAFAPAACRQDFANLSTQVEALLSPNAANFDFNDNALVRVRIQYAAPTPELADAAAFLRDAKILEELRDDLVESIAMPIEVTLLAASCGSRSTGFSYSRSTRVITACYEEVDWFLFGPPLNNSATSQGTALAGDEIGVRRPRQQAPLRPRPPPPPPQPG